MAATKRVTNVKKETGAEKRKRLESMKSARSTAYRYILPALALLVVGLAVALYWRYGRGGALPNDPRAILRRAMREAAKNMKSMAGGAAGAGEAVVVEPAVVVEN